MMDGESVDKWVTHGVLLSFPFCLKLPQYIYTVGIDTYTSVSTTSTLMSAMNVARSLTGYVVTGSTSTSPAVLPTKSNPNITSPAMTFFMYSSGSSKNTNKFYYGPLIFLDTQADCNLTYCSWPVILSASSMNNDCAPFQKILWDYAEKCKLDIIIYLCMLNYVGRDKLNPVLNVQEACRNWNHQTRMNFRRQNHYRHTWIFFEFIWLSVSLPEDATTWSI